MYFFSFWMVVFQCVVGSVCTKPSTYLIHAHKSKFIVKDPYGWMDEIDFSSFCSRPLGILVQGRKQFSPVKRQIQRTRFPFSEIWRKRKYVCWRVKYKYTDCPWSILSVSYATPSLAASLCYCWQCNINTGTNDNIKMKQSRTS